MPSLSAWALLALLSAQAPAAAPNASEARAERERAQNRLVGDLMIHTFASVSCARSYRLGGEGERCWVWFGALELGGSLDRLRDGGFARSGTLAWAPATLGSWHWKDEHRFTDFEFALLEPFVRARGGARYDSAGQEAGNFLGLALGSRAWVAWAFLRAGVELAYEFGPPEVAGAAVSLFAGLAWHFAPTRGERVVLGAAPGR